MATDLDFGSSVWNRTGRRGEMSRQQFNLVMLITLLGGLAVTAITAYYTTGWMELVPGVDGKKPSWHWVASINPLVLYVGVLISGIVGVCVSLGSDKPAVSLLGYLMVAIPFGLILGPFVGMYTPDSVVKVMVLTGVVTGVLGLVGVMIPESLEKWGTLLFIGLCVLLICTFGLPVLAWLIPGLPTSVIMTWMDWAGVILFSAYIVFDMNRAQHVPATYDNAIDCALATYLDVINLFIRLLRLLGTKKSD